MNFHEYWFKHLHHMHNIHICIFLQDICKTNNFHLHHYLVAFTSTISCWGKSMHHKHIHSHLHPHEGHLHYKKFSFTPSYGCIHVCISNKDFCIRHSMNKHLHHIRMDICITRFSFAPTQGCDHVCISNKDFALSIAGAYHFEDSTLFYSFEVLTYVSVLGYPFSSLWGFNPLLSIWCFYPLLSIWGFNLCFGIRLSSFIHWRFLSSFIHLRF